MFPSPIQLDLLKHTRVHRRRESRPLFGGRRNEQLFPWRRRLHLYTGGGSTAGLGGRRRVVHAMGWASRTQRTLALGRASTWWSVAGEC